MEKIQYIVKRNGLKAAFDPNKIRNAITKAFLSTNTSNLEAVQKITDAVVNKVLLEISSGTKLTVEKTQDTVEDILIEHGFSQIAKKYIVYRQEHKMARQEKILEKIDQGNLFISSSEGNSIPFEKNKLQNDLILIAENLKHVDVSKISHAIASNLYENMPFSEFRLLILNAAKERIEIHYDYSYMASRILLDKLYKDILGQRFFSDTLKQEYQDRFKNYIAKGIEEDMLTPALEKFDLKKIAEAIVPKRDHLFMYLGIQIVEDRYLLRDRTLAQNVYELPQWMWMRIAMGLAQNEAEKETRAIEFYNTLSQMHLLSSTPTLFNSGTNHSQMSSCYINTVEDSLDGIFKIYGDNARLSKWAGGIGSDWTPIRSTGSQIKGTNGLSQGVIPFIKIFNDVALAVNQGGKRKGAMVAYMEIWHNDIEQFLELRKNTGDERRRAHDINTACWVPDLFMKRISENGSWTLFSPAQVPDLHDLYGKEFEARYAHYESLNMEGTKTMPAAELWQKLLTMLYETGHPWITFKDPINVRSPQDHCGRVHSSNLCTEITLNTSKEETAVCNLASLNLATMIKDGEINESLLAKTIETGIRMLDNVIDLNFYPIPEAETSNMRHRPIGLGLMGYQDALYMSEIAFDSEENLDFADRTMEMISYYAIWASSRLAKERSPYSTYKGSKWDRGIFPLDSVNLLEEERGKAIQVNRTTRMDWKKVKAHVAEYGMRNSNTMAIAPTATIANITGVMPCVEPTYKNIYMKENLSGNFLVINKYLVDELGALGLWNKDILGKIKLHNGSLQPITDIPQDIRTH